VNAILNRLRGRPPESPSLTRRQALSAFPVRNPELQWRELESEEVVVTVKSPSRLSWRLISWLFYLPATRTITLDEVGSFVWRLCDGEHSVSAMVKALCARYKLGKREAEVSLTTYLRDLGRRGLIAFAVPEDNGDAKVKHAAPEQGGRPRRNGIRSPG